MMTVHCRLLCTVEFLAELGCSRVSVSWLLSTSFLQTTDCDTERGKKTNSYQWHNNWEYFETDEPLELLYMYINVGWQINCLDLIR